MVYFWLAIILYLSILEVITLNKLSIWFVISGIFSLIISYFSNNYIIQFNIFIFIGLILMFVFKKPLERRIVNIYFINIIIFIIGEIRGTRKRIKHRLRRKIFV